MEKTFFIADTHFGHGNVIGLSKRPFKDVEEMDGQLIANWNKVVGNDDLVYIIGDFWYRGADSPVNYIRKLSGKKILIKGNHDTKSLKNQEFVKEFEEILDIKEIVLGNNRIIMCHYPMLEWNGYFKGSYMVHGHIHNNLPLHYEVLLKEERLLNAGVDVINNQPVTFDELIQLNIEYKKNKGFKNTKTDINIGG